MNNHGIVKIADILPVGLLADLEERSRKPAPEKIRVEPKPPRVIGDPVREPVNFQAATMFFKSNWLTAPMPAETLKVETREQLKARIAELERKLAIALKENEALRRQRPKTKTVEVVKEIVVDRPVADPRIDLLEKLQGMK